MSKLSTILDAASFRDQATATPALPGAISIQKVAGALSSVDDQGNAIAIGVGTPFNQFQQYVSTLGNDANSGKDFQHAKLTTDAALTALQAAGGGELHIDDGVKGNIWLRGDHRTVAGWHGDFPLRVIGHGPRRTQFGFPSSGLVSNDANIGQSGDRFNPIIWIAGTATPKEFHNLSPAIGFCNTFIRMWDYRRNTDTTIQFTNIASWTRNNDQTSTLTLALPTGFAIASATVVHQTVTITFTVPFTNANTSTIGQWIRINSTDSTFDSGDFQCINGTEGIANQMVYTQTTDRGATPITHTNIGNVQTHGIAPRDRIDIVSTQHQNIPSTSFRVKATGPDAVTVTLTDPYGGLQNGQYGGNYAATGTWSSPGTWAYQERGYFSSSLVDFYNIAGACAPNVNYDYGAAGPLIDLGGTADDRNRWFRIAPTGFVPALQRCPDPDRECYLLGDGGSRGVSGFEVYNANTNLAGIRLYGGAFSTSTTILRDIVGDVGVGQFSPPEFELNENTGYITLKIDNVFNADRSEGFDIVINGGTSQFSHIIGCGNVLGATGGNCYISQNAVFGTQNSLFTNGQYGWDRGRLYGDLPQARRATSISTARFSNLILVPGGWSIVGGSVTATAGIADPFGGTGAVRVTGDTNSQIAAVQDGYSVSPVAGDKYIFGGWFRVADGMHHLASSFLILSLQGSTPGVPIQQAFVASAFDGDGEWQWYTGSMTVLAGLGGQSAPYTLRYVVSPAHAGTIDCYGLFFNIIPASLGLTNNEVSEYLACTRNLPQYLPGGMSGTMENTKFIAHGGLGIDTAIARAVGGSSGQLTLGSVLKYEPRYTKDGTVYGWVPIYSATVNP